MCYKTILIAVLSFMQIIPSAFAADPDSSMGGGDSRACIRCSESQVPSALFPKTVFH